MWKDYSISYMKNNRASSIAIMTAAFIASLFLSFLCSLFYNFWQDSIAGIILEEGDWQGRITGEIDSEEIGRIRNFPGVLNVITNDALSEGKEITLDLYFEPVSKIKTALPEIIEELGLQESAAQYHYQLLAMYFVRIKGDPMPRLLLPAYLVIVLIVCLSLVLIIHHSYAVSMNSRIHQFGIFSSVGATPKQIRLCLMQEAAVLACIPVLVGIFLGIGLSYGTILIMGRVAADTAGGREAVFSCPPVLILLTFFICAFTVFISAWMPAGKLSRFTPLEAIRGMEELELKKKKNSRILAALFGAEGELAGDAFRARKKAFRTSTVSLTLAFLGFMLMQCFFTLSSISTEYTYFAKYQNSWDVMATVKDTDIRKFKHIKKIEKLQGTRSSTVYQKAKAVCVLQEDDISRELKELGGLFAVAENAAEKEEMPENKRSKKETPSGHPFMRGNERRKEENGYRAEAQLVILDDQSFLEYLRQIGAKESLDGAVILNRIWDSLHSNFRYRNYIPYRNEAGKTSLLQGSKEEKAAVVPVLAYTEKEPVLREEYDDYALVHILPLSLWNQIEPQIGGAEQDTYIRLLAEEGADINELNRLEALLIEKAGTEYEIESENRIFEKTNNDEIIRGYKMILGAFCILLAIIGIANVFSNTLGFLRQRKREFARYMSVGLTPFGIKKIFCIEAVILVGRPVLLAASVTVFLTGVMIKASYLEPLEFIKQAPVLTIGVFVLAVYGFVAFAYYLGGRQILKCSLADVLREDTMI